MAKEALTKSVLTEVFEVTPHLLKFPKNKLWIDYDEEADVLYLSFQRPQKAIESEMRDDGVLLRYKRDKLDLLNYLIFSDVWQRENLSP